jgi:hypothetical protein
LAADSPVNADTDQPVSSGQSLTIGKDDSSTVDIFWTGTEFSSQWKGNDTVSKWSRWLVLGAAATWLFMVVYGFAAFATLEPSGSGFTRGLNRITAFLGWQFAALLAAAVAFARRPGAKDAGLIYWLSRIPLWLSGSFFALLVIFLAGLFAYSWLGGE